MLLLKPPKKDHISCLVLNYCLLLKEQLFTLLSSGPAPAGKLRFLSVFDVVDGKDKNLVVEEGKLTRTMAKKGDDDILLYSLLGKGPSVQRVQ